MAKRSMNTLSASFLDLLAGALGAVLILYIIVPKLNIPVEEFERQQEIAEEINKMGLSLEALAGMIPEEELRKLQEQIQTLQESLAEEQKQFDKIYNELEECKSELSRVIADYQVYKQWMDSCGFSPGDPCPRLGGADVDVGFKFKDKQIVFLLDVSGSMENEDKIGQVKAGIKMLLNTMGNSYSVDIVSFTTDENNVYRNIIIPFWNGLEVVGDDMRMEAYIKLNELQPLGYTPTGSALEFVLREYDGISDIVLLTDGLPSEEDMDIPTILSMVQRINTNDVRINTIGVGANFTNNPTDETVQFLKDLAVQNNGFFIGF